jgi:two-component system response regulator LytT
MTIAICDDSAIDCILSKFLINEYFKKRKMTCSIITYETGAKLLSDFENGTVFDIVFMDIYVGDELGIDVAGKLRNEGYDNLLIFSTITPEYAIASYSVKANGYILKPFNPLELKIRIKKIID